MEDSGVILQYKTIFSNEVQAPVTALIEVKIRPEKKTGFSKIAQKISKFPEVTDHYLISGNYDYLVVAEGENLNAISTFVSEKLSVIENIQNTVTHFIMRKYKEKGVLLSKDETLKRLPVSP